ncbi:MAG: hypothetical protein ACRYFR_10155 [Janthinobacterium lividum]
MRLIGESRDQTVLIYDDYHQKMNRFGEGKGTSGLVNCYAYGGEFRAENLTF